jgi:putative ABC transport system permease protein
MFMWLSDSKYTNAGPRIAFLKEVVSRLGALPGVQGVAVSNDMPIGGTDTSTYPAIEGRPPADQSEQVLMGIHVVNPGYFEAMRIPIIRGRVFDEHDDSQSKAVTIISESLADRFWPNEDPIGKHIGTGQPDGWKEIIGIVGDVRYEGLHERAGFHSYSPHLQEPSPYFALALRSSLDQASLQAAVRREVQAIDPNQPISDVKTMNDTIAQSVASRRLSMMLFSLFAVVALVLTIVGIYGVVAYGVTLRTHEIGIRMALGAQRRDVLRLVINQGLTMASIGVAIGLVVSFAMTRLMEALLFEVSATDFATFAVIGLALAGIVSLACYLPARKAAQVDPMVALRYE